MSGEIPDELLSLAADALRRYEWDHGISANPDVGQHQRAEAAAILAAVLPAAREQWFIELFGDPERRREQPVTVDDIASLVGTVEDWKAEHERQVRERVAAETRSLARKWSANAQATPRLIERERRVAVANALTEHADRIARGGAR